MRVRLTKDVQHPDADDRVIPAGTVLRVEDLTLETENGGCSFSVSVDEVEPLATEPEDLGFEEWDLQGGGKGYGLIREDGGTILITDETYPDQLPGSNAVLVGFYDADGRREEMDTYAELEVALINLRRHVAQVA